MGVSFRFNTALESGCVPVGSRRALGRLALWIAGRSVWGWTSPPTASLCSLDQVSLLFMGQFWEIVVVIHVKCIQWMFIVVVTQLFVFEIMNSYELNFLSGNATFCVFVRCSRESLKKVTVFPSCLMCIEASVWWMLLWWLKGVYMHFPEILTHINIFVYSLGE